MAALFRTKPEDFRRSLKQRHNCEQFIKRRLWSRCFKSNGVCQRHSPLSWKHYVLRARNRWKSFAWRTRETEREREREKGKGEKTTGKKWRIEVADSHEESTDRASLGRLISQEREREREREDLLPKSWNFSWIKYRFNENNLSSRWHLLRRHRRQWGMINRSFFPLSSSPQHRVSIKTATN